MRYAKLLYATGTTLAVILAVLAIGPPLAAQEHKSKHTHYKLIDLGTFGGPNSYVSFTPIPMNSDGTVVGTADTPFPDPFAPNCLLDCFVAHTFQWRKGALTDLGALADGASSTPNGINAAGVVAGISENGMVDPQAPFPPEFDAVVWKDGQIVDLGTFGGTFSYANAINNRNQVVGFALNGVPSSFFMDECQGGPMPTQMRAFIWQEGSGLQDLGTLGGPESCALWINQRGQVAGHSFTSSTPNPGTGIPTQDPFLWTQHDGMTDIGTLGGTIGHASGINSRGQVAGDSNLAGDQVQHAFLWDKGKMQDLTPGRGFSFAHALNDKGEVVGASDNAVDQRNAFLWRHGVLTDLESVPGECGSFASGINSKSQIVGESFPCTVDEGHAAIWEDGGSAVDLNTLVRPNSGLQLAEADFINARGEITGIAVLPNGDQHAFVLIPDDQNYDGTGSAAAEANPPSVTQPPAASPRSHMPGMLNRFRTPLGRGIPGPGTVPAAKQALPANTDGLDSVDDHMLDPQAKQYQYQGYCGAHNGRLNGYCVGSTVYSCPTSRPNSACPERAKVKTPGTVRCPSGNPYPVDLGRVCRF